MKSEIVVFWKSKVPQFHSETTLPLEAQYIGCEGRKVFLPLSSSVSPFFCFMPYLRILTIFYIPNVHFI